MSSPRSEGEEDVVKPDADDKGVVKEEEEDEEKDVVALEWRTSTASLRRLSDSYSAARSKNSSESEEKVRELARSMACREGVEE